MLQPVAPGTTPDLTDPEAAPPGGLPRGAELKAELAALLERMERKAAALSAERTRALLVVLQGRDAGGKDGTIRHVFRGINPQNVVVAAFGPPAGEELLHDYLWRAHRVVPPFGKVGIFNRSHYEDVLAARVMGLAPEAAWRERYGEINGFERTLTRNGYTILKLFLHISRDEQRRRILRRLTRPHHNWKFAPSDLEARAAWDDYTQAYRDMLAKCSTGHAPWYVVPADDKHARNLLVARLVADTLDRMDPRFPAADPEVLAAAERMLK